MAIDVNADFTPSIPDSGVNPSKLPYNPTGSFKFWAQKVLPLVYDDSLSYYEVLCKVVDYLNNVIQNIDNLNDSVDNTNTGFQNLQSYVNDTKDTLIATYNELQGYVNDYFDNLDVQQEINEKLDAMADSGELTTLLEPFIPALVTNWLNTHVTPTTPVVDNTLSISGAAADALVTGNNIVPIKGIANIEEYDSLMVNITKSGRYQIQGEWLDFPDTSTTGQAGVLFVYQYGTTYVIQIFYCYLGDLHRTHYRIVHKDNHTTYIDWTNLSSPWVRKITASDDLNNILEDGVYQWSNVANTPVNAPFRLNGMLIVISNVPSSNTVQIVISSILETDGNIAIRSSQTNNTVWTPWIYPAFASEPIPNGSIVPIKGIANITEYESLMRNITKAGRYQIQGDWLDFPDTSTTGQAGVLFVYPYGASYVMQIFYCYLGDLLRTHYRIVHKDNHTTYIDWTNLSSPWVRKITASDDLNNILEEGVYQWSNVANTPINAPFRLNGMLIVISNVPSSNTVQIVISSILDTDGNIAIRSSQSDNTVWTPWVYLATTSSPIAKDSVYHYWRSLVATDDLNNITDGGTYWYSDPNKPLNAPDIQYGGIIYVFGSGSSTSQKCQVYVGYGVAPNAYEPKRNQMAYRVLAGGVWSDWYYIKTNTSPDNYNSYKNKRLSILGDSISTYEGYVPTGTGYASYYDGTNCGVTSVDQTWWKRLLNKTGMVLCKNNSVSGSCMSTGARQDRISGCLPERTGALKNNSNQSPDIIIVYMGMNDFVNEVEIGTYDGDGTVPTDVTVFRNAYATAMLALLNNYPNAKIFVCTTHHTEFDTTSQKIQIKRSGLTQAEFNNVIRELASIFCLEVIDFEHCGITTGNILSCTGDNTQAGGTLGRGLHPNAKGHELLYLEALKHFS